MLISPPFLPTRNDDQSEADWLSTAMSSVSPGFIPGLGDDTISGSYPVSMELGWHGGMHLVAPPGDGDATLPVRAVADGTVIYVRQPKTQNSDADEPLNYGAPPGGRCWTSDGVVLIRHETDIGASAEGQAVSVVFYSLYMHLDAIAEGVKTNRRIYRKEELGSAGYIYGQPHRIHFEIFCDDQNLQRLTGRNSGDLPTGQDGQSSVVFGELSFHLPSGAPIYAHQPAANLATPTTAKAYTTTEDLIIGLRYAEGSGASGHRGDATVTTYHADGTVEGNPIGEPDAEYNLYTHAKTIAEAYPENARPAPSAVYELLRFGRVINTANETLTPADVPHWRKIRYPGGQGWINLSASNVHKFSDADFPHWKGWCFIDDSTDRDSRCDSPTIRRWFNTNQDAWVDIAEARAGLGNETLLAKLEHTICKFPSEWRADTLDERWAWLMKPEDEDFESLSDDDFKEFKAHAQALCFWEKVPAQTPALPDNPWRFHPRRFIQMFRRCGWLSAGEFKQLVPKHAIRRHAQTYLWEPINTNITSATCIATTHRNPVNFMTRKYGISAPMRMASFFGNAVQETGWLSTLHESGGNSLWYAPWFGRGFLQLTNPENYATYWGYRGRTIPATLKTSLINSYAEIAVLPVSQRNNQTLQDALFPQLTQEMIGWRNSVSTGQFDPADSAGYYWAKLKMARFADATHILERVAVSTSVGQKYYYRSSSFWRASAAVNLPGAINNLYSHALNGFDSRCVAYGYAIATLSEMYFPDQFGQVTLDFPEGYERRAIK